MWLKADHRQWASADSRDLCKQVSGNEEFVGVREAVVGRGGTIDLILLMFDFNLRKVTVTLL